MNRRSELLHEADQLINGDRNNQYGPPSQDFERTALFWSTYLSGRRMIEAHDVAVMMNNMRRWRRVAEQLHAEHCTHQARQQPSSCNRVLEEMYQAIDMKEIGEL